MAGMPPQEEEDVAELKLGKQFNKAKCLMNAEVAMILDAKLETLQAANPDEDPLSQVTPVFEKARSYVKRFNRYQNKETVQQVRELLANQKKLAEFEVCVIGNLAPETVDEAKALVPSLVNVPRSPMLDDEHIETLLQDMARLKKFE